MLLWQWNIILCQLNYQKSEVFVVNLRVAIYGNQRIKGLREKGE